MTKVPDVYRKSNDFIKSSMLDATALQQKVINYALCQVNGIEDSEFGYCEINLRDFCKTHGMAVCGASFNAIRDAVEALKWKNIHYWVQTDKAEGGKRTLRILDDVIHAENTGTIHIKFDDDLKPAFLQLNGYFTSIKYMYSAKFKNKYSSPLYEQLSSVHYHKTQPYTHYFELEELRWALGATDKTYEEFKEFNRRVLKPAVEEIGKYTDINVSYKTLKNKRVVVGIVFEIAPKDAAERALLGQPTVIVAPPSFVVNIGDGEQQVLFDQEAVSEAEEAPPDA